MNTDKERVWELFEVADQRGLVDEAADIMADSYVGTVVDDDEPCMLRDSLGDAFPQATFRRINWQTIREGLERLLAPH